jgi:hypothetical protein
MQAKPGTILRRRKATMRYLIQALGWGMIVLAVTGVGVQIDEARAGKGGEVAAGIVFIVLFGGGGALLVRTGRRMKRAGEPAALSGASIEQRVLAAARRQRGHVTAVSVAAEGSVTLEQARTELERLAKENACLMNISPDGLVVFRFPEFETAEHRASPPAGERHG